MAPHRNSTNGNREWHPGNGTPAMKQHGTQQWYPTMAPSNSTTPWRPQIRKWHSAMAPHHGTTPSAKVATTAPYYWK